MSLQSCTKLHEHRDRLAEALYAGDDWVGGINVSRVGYLYADALPNFVINGESRTILITGCSYEDMARKIVRLANKKEPDMTPWITLGAITNTDIVNPDGTIASHYSLVLTTYKTRQNSEMRELYRLMRKRFNPVPSWDAVFETVGYPKDPSTVTEANIGELSQRIRNFSSTVYGMPEDSAISTLTNDGSKTTITIRKGTASEYSFTLLPSLLSQDHENSLKHLSDIKKELHKGTPFSEVIPGCSEVLYLKPREKTSSWVSNPRSIEVRVAGTDNVHEALAEEFSRWEPVLHHWVHIGHIATFPTGRNHGYMITLTKFDTEYNAEARRTFSYLSANYETEVTFEEFLEATGYLDASVFGFCDYKEVLELIKLLADSSKSCKKNETQRISVIDKKLVLVTEKSNFLRSPKTRILELSAPAQSSD